MRANISNFPTTDSSHKYIKTEQQSAVSSQQSVLFSDPSVLLSFMAQISMSFKICHLQLPTSEEDEVFSKLITCCQAVSDAKSVEAGADYSVGTTYFIRSDQAPGNILEECALSIFRSHTSTLNFDANLSGAEYWAQVIDSRDDIGFHWDRDYGLEEDEGIHVYPHLGTVTYLSDFGGPTVVVNKAGTSRADDKIPQECGSYLLIKPSMGKHITFKGDLLHAASADFLTKEGFLQQAENDADNNNGDDDEEDESDDDSDSVPKRITFLVNIWLDHVPTHGITPSPKLAKELKTLSSVGKENNNISISISSQSAAEIIMTGPSRELFFNFTTSDYNCNIILPVPALSELNAVLATTSSVFVNTNALEKQGSLMEVIYCGTCSADDASDDYEDGDDENDDDSDEYDDSNDGDDDYADDGKELSEETKPKKIRRSNS